MADWNLQFYCWSIGSNNSSFDCLLLRRWCYSESVAEDYLQFCWSLANFSKNWPNWKEFPKFWTHANPLMSWTQIGYFCWASMQLCIVILRWCLSECLLQNAAEILSYFTPQGPFDRSVYFEACAWSLKVWGLLTLQWSQSALSIWRNCLEAWAKLREFSRIRSLLCYFWRLLEIRHSNFDHYSSPTFSC